MCPWVPSSCELLTLACVLWLGLGGLADWMGLQARRQGGFFVARKPHFSPI